MIYIYFVGFYDDKRIKFISEDLTEFKNYVVSDYVAFHAPDSKQKWDDTPSQVQIWDKEDKCFKLFKGDEGRRASCIYLDDAITFEEFIQLIERIR